MDQETPIAPYDGILGGKLLSRAEEKAPAESASKQAEPAGERIWIPELKRVVQLTDNDGKNHLLGFENYKPKRAPQRRREEPKPEPFKEYAMLLKAILHQNHFGDPKIDLRLEIQSESLINIFRKIATPYRELNLDVNPIVIEYPFRCLFFLRGRLRELSQATEVSFETQRELVQLLDFIQGPLGVQRYIEVYNDLVPQRKVTFRMLWAIFPPYEPVIWGDQHDGDDGGSGYILESITLKDDKEKGASYEIQLLYGHHNGSRYHLRRIKGTVAHFSGVKEISLRQLPLIPLHLVEETQRKRIWDSFVERGKTYVRYCTAETSFMHYKGPVTLRNEENNQRLGDWGSTGFLQIDDRVVLDRTAQHKVAGFSDAYGDSVATCLVDYLSTTKAEQPAESVNSSFGDSLTLRDLAKLDKPGSRTIDADKSETVRGMIDPTADITPPKAVKLTDDDFFICRSSTVAFALNQKVWVYNVRISLLKEIDWDGDPFQSLQLGENAKTLVFKLVKGFNARKEDVYDDIISGKGKGLVFLLHGPPGLGKTLTAESVAESAQRPLYRVTTGELSTDVEKLEKQLSDVFRLGARWKAVVLLDEADVLMSRRTVEDLRRNSIVAVFLRLLEYYKGMLFLTTNRHQDFDEAFYSRIHVTIEFAGLTPEWRGNIWEEHVRRASAANKIPGMWKKEMFKLLGEIETNGRDIKNYTRTAYAFARADDEDITLRHVLVVLKNNLPARRKEAHSSSFAKLDLLEAELSNELESSGIGCENVTVTANAIIETTG